METVMSRSKNIDQSLTFYDIFYIMDAVKRFGGMFRGGKSNFKSGDRPFTKILPIPGGSDGERSGTDFFWRAQ